MKLEELLAMAGITAQEIIAYADGVLGAERRQAVRDALAKYPDLLEVLAAKAGITAEEVMAYADGVLAPDRREVVRDALAKYPDLMQLLESYLATRGRLAEPFVNLPNPPAPDWMLSELQKAELSAVQVKRFSLINWLKIAIRGQRLANYRLPMVAVAALSAVLVGATWFLSYAARQGTAAPGGYDFVTLDERGLVASASLQRALERTPSGEQARLSERLSIKPRSTYRTRQDRWCREFDLIFNIGLQAGAMACRGDDGAWRVHVTTVPPGKKYGVAGEKSGDPLPEQPKGKMPNEGEEILDGVKRRIGSDQVVAPEREKRLIEGHWQDKP
jgi:anti-sigma factor RsiW